MKNAILSEVLNVDLLWLGLWEMSGEHGYDWSWENTVRGVEDSHVGDASFVPVTWRIS